MAEIKRPVQKVESLLKHLMLLGPGLIFGCGSAQVTETFFGVLSFKYLVEIHDHEGEYIFKSMLGNEVKLNSVPHEIIEEVDNGGEFQTHGGGTWIHDHSEKIRVYTALKSLIEGRKK